MKSSIKHCYYNLIRGRCTNYGTSKFHLLMYISSQYKITIPAEAILFSKMFFIYVMTGWLLYEYLSELVDIQHQRPILTVNSVNTIPFISCTLITVPVSLQFHATSLHNHAIMRIKSHFSISSYVSLITGSVINRTCIMYMHHTHHRGHLRR